MQAYYFGQALYLASWILKAEARLFPKKIFKEPTRPKAEKLGAQKTEAAKNVGAQSIFLGTPGYRAPVRQ